MQNFQKTFRLIKLQTFSVLALRIIKVSGNLTLRRNKILGRVHL